MGTYQLHSIFSIFFLQIFVQIEMTVEWPGSQKLKRISQKYLFRQKSFKNRKFQLLPQKKRQLAGFLNKICQLFYSLAYRVSEYISTFY